LSEAAWQVLSLVQAQVRGRETDPQMLTGFLRLCEASLILRVYVRVPGTREAREISEYVGDLPQDCFYFTGPSPVKLVLSFPKPKVTLLQQAGKEEGAGDMAVLLQKMPVREAFIRTDTGKPVRVKVVNVPFPECLPEAEPYLCTGQDAQEIKECHLNRLRQIEAVSQGIASAPAPLEATGEAVLALPPEEEPKSGKERRMKKTNGKTPKTATPPVREALPELEVADDGSL
jgi:hypothetical protein